MIKSGYLEATLRNLYIMNGADEGSHGSLQDTIMAAKIAAYEGFISDWRQEIAQSI